MTNTNDIILYQGLLRKAKILIKTVKIYSKLIQKLVNLIGSPEHYVLLFNCDITLIMLLINLMALTST